MMNRMRLAALLLTSGMMVVQAQPIYRCGSSYSQTPCASGQEIQASDARNTLQKQQTDDATRRDAALARSLEKERLAQEKQALTPLHAPVAAPAAPASRAATLSSDAKPIKPQRLNAGKGKDFVAEVPGTRPARAAKKKNKKKAPVSPA